MRRLAALALASLLSTAHADSWVPAAPRGVTSPDGRIVVRVLPGDSLGDVVGFAGARKGQPARAVFYRLEGEDRYLRYQSAQLLNPIAPVDVAVTNAGELVTLDNWHNAGYGKVVAVYGPDGQVRRSHPLTDLYSAEELRRMQRSVSSILWRCPHPLVLDPRGTTAEVMDTLGNLIDVDLQTGAAARRGTHKGC